MQINEQVVTDFIAGDIEAFRIVYEATKKLIFSAIIKITGNVEDAEDIMHDTYIKVFEKRGLYKKEKTALNTWIYKVAVNNTLNMIRRKKNWLNWAKGTFFENAEEDNCEHIIKKEDNEEIKRLLDKIKPEFRICLILKDMEEKSYEEIAGILNISIGTVKSRINRGRKKLELLFQGGE
jgi:RNA polymerase sigma-70 factor (ECF subfamily)